MAAIHHLAVCGQNDRKGQVGIFNQPNVIDDRAPGLLFVLARPRAIEFPETLNSYWLVTEIPRKRDEPIDVPRQQALWRRPKEVFVPILAPFADGKAGRLTMWPHGATFGW